MRLPRACTFSRWSSAIWPVRYNDIGIRRWFDRKRSALDGRAPAQVLSGEWDPDDPGPARVRALARELVTLSAT